MRPLIGIVSAVFYNSLQWKYLRAYTPNISAIEAVGGIPVIVPCILGEEALRGLYTRLDGILLPGGGDIDPANYGAVQHEATQFVDRERDAAEILLARWAVEDGKPIFGICRGHQMLNVALGGTLVQDIPTECETELRHDILKGEEPRDALLHTITVEPETKLAKILGGTAFSVNSLHHQGIGKVAESLKATAYAPDGMIEGLEVPDHPFALSVQWHPEDLVGGHEAMLGLFKAFVDTCRSHLMP